MGEIIALLNFKYKDFLVDPDISITIDQFRQIKVYVGGEVNRPGYYSLTGQLSSVFTALQAANGITPFTNLSEINVVRKIPISKGGGKKRATVDILRLITAGDDSENIKSYDGDIIMVSKDSEIIREQILKAAQSHLLNLYQYLFVVNKEGQINLPQGVILNSAIIAAEVPKH